MILHHPTEGINKMSNAPRLFQTPKPAYISPLHGTLYDLFHFFDTAPFHRQPQLNLEVVDLIEKIRSQFAKDFDFAQFGGGAGFAGYGKD